MMRSSGASTRKLWSSIGDDSGAMQEGSGEGGLLPRLTEPSDMDFDHFRQSGHDKIPLVGQSVAPAALGNFAHELRIHDLDDFRSVSIGIEVEVTSEVRPMIQRLDYRDGAPALFKSRTNFARKLTACLIRDRSSSREEATNCSEFSSPRSCRIGSRRSNARTMT